ncbi:MAG: amidohydrolase family protein [Candidatus Nanohaloarchaea archaeon]|nr:amidohydrolase family protein [Candidatus Nanohaloarchaea archaeon]
MRDGFRVFDAHTHVGGWGSWEMKGREVSPFSSPIASKEALKEHMERRGIDRQIVMPHYHPELDRTFEGNRLAVELAGMDNVHAAVFFEPSHGERLDELKDLAGEDAVVALKTSADAWKESSYNPETWSIEQERFMEELLDYAAGNGLPIQFHTGTGSSDPRNLFEMVDEYPEPAYHFVHMGGTAGGHFAFVPRFLERIDSHDIYCDTSWSRGFGVRWLVRKISQRGMLNRLMFASDEPWGDVPGEFAKVAGLNIEEEDKQRILYGNAEKLYVEGS